MPWRHMGGGGIAPPFLTSALHRGAWSASRPSRFTPGKEPPVPIGQETVWAPEPVWKLWRREKSWPCRKLNPGRLARSPSPVAIPTPIQIWGGVYKYYTKQDVSAWQVEQNLSTCKGKRYSLNSLYFLTFLKQGAHRPTLNTPSRSVSHVLNEYFNGDYFAANVRSIILMRLFSVILFISPYSDVCPISVELIKQFDNKKTI
jgi:hypothetical protein